MLSFIIAWLITGFLSFIAYGVEKLIDEKEYTLRTLILSLLWSIGGPILLILDSVAIIGICLLGIGAWLEMFIRDETMFKSKILFKIKKK